MHPRLGRGWAKAGERLRILTASDHHQRLNVSGWVAPLLGRYGMIRTEKGDRQGFLKLLVHLYGRLKDHIIWLYVDGARWHKGKEVDEFIRHHNLNLHDRFENNRFGAFCRFLNRHRTRNFKGYFRGIDIMVGTVVKLDRNINQSVTGDNTAVQAFSNPLFNR